MSLRSEEDVKFQFLVPYLEERGYSKSCMAFNVAIDVQEGRKKKTIFADLIVYTSSARKAPLLVCETKGPNEVLSRADREQAISYARLLPNIAPLALLTNGASVQVFHTLNKSRLGELPPRKELDSDIVKFVLAKDVQDALRQEAKHELFIIDDVTTFKSILKACHNEIRNNEGLDPTAAFDEMSKVMFCKLYEEKENPKGNRFRLSVFEESMERLKFNVVTKIFDDAKADPAYAGLFQKNSRINLKDRTIKKIVELFESYDLGLTAFDVKGEAFEYFLGDTFTGGLGEFFTPRNIVEFMVEAIDPRIGEKIIDPFCGTGGFMIYAFEVVSEKIRLQEFGEDEKKRWRFELSNRSLYGTDWKERTSQACKMNMMVHGDGSSGVFMHDGFIDVPGKIVPGEFDICLTNPPFGSFENDPKVLKLFELGAGRKSQDRVVLAVERVVDLIKPGGRIGIVVIDGILNNQRMKYVRDFIARETIVDGIVSLNKETFEGYGARAKTSILFLRKRDPNNPETQKEAFMAIAENTGLAPNGSAVPGNVLPDILLDFREYLKGRAVGKHSRSWRATIADRLDAEFYAQTINEAKSDLVSLRAEIADIRNRINDAYKALAAIDNVFANVETCSIILGEIFEETGERVVLEKSTVYRLLGVRWWGEGAFVREEKLGREIKASALYKVSAGHIIYNRLFAFRGSFAITQDDHDGCFVSGEFPMYKPREGVKDPDVISRFVVHALNSPQYLGVVDRLSTGSTKTSRNRFNQSHFEAMRVRAPVRSSDLKRVVELLDKATTLRTLQERQLNLFKGLREDVYRMIPLEAS